MFISLAFHCVFLSGRGRGGVITGTQGNGCNLKCKKFMLNTVNLTAEPLMNVIINYPNALFFLKFGPGCVKIWVCLWVCVPHGRKVNSWSSITGTQKE